MKKLILLFVLGFFVIFIPAACAVGFVAMEIFGGDYSQFSKEKILEILSKETILFYADGTSQLGSLFGQEHRIYVGIDKIPQVMKDSIVSAEDVDFYTNIGIDIKGIIRAAIHNLLFRTRQGASTITQQTVKNLYGRKETDLSTKFFEMINAFKMERIFSKDQILEFYLNQFHVTGNGRGVGVASKYYFNKDVEDLNLVEAAFIAGSVKGPEKYNPFTKTTLASQEKAKNDANIRKNYVLERMFKNNKIGEKDYEDAIKTPVPFSQGRFQYNEIVVNQIVQKQLTKPEILKALGANTVDEIGTMGLHITTTLDKDIQSAAQYGLRKNLSGMQMILKGFQTEPSHNFVNIQKPELYSFYVGRVENVDKSPDHESIHLNFGVTSCVVDTDSINQTAIKLDQTSRKGLNKSKAILLNELYSGDLVLTSIKKVYPNGLMNCDLETRPKVQGASLVLDKGKIIAMAGGFSSNEYNRALFAQRQPGSTFKIPTFYAALQLGWSVVDSIPNVRDIFPWQGNLYFPRPDHLPVSFETTILGAGAKSENLASIWLLEHMLDKINYNQYLDLLKFLGLSSDGMNKSQILSKIAFKFNASPDSEDNLKEGLLNKIKNEMMSDLNVISQNKLKVFIRTLHYGINFDKQDAAILADKELTDKEQKIRLNLLKNNLIRWSQLANNAIQALDTLDKIAQGTENISESNREILSSFYNTENQPDSVTFMTKDAWQPELTSSLLTPYDHQNMSFDNLISLARNHSELLNPNHILLDGVVPLSLIKTIEDNLAAALADIHTKDPLERLFWNADFRYSLAMYYTAQMTNAMGVSAQIQWVPSFPLGSNVVTLADLSLMYQTFLSGKLYKYFNNNKQNQLLIIKRIEDSNGNLLWESKVKELNFADSFYSTPILNTMRGTVTAGTAYLKLNNSMILRSDDDDLDRKLQDAKIKVPTFGKTGTTNNFTNGTYIGYLPYPTYEGDNLSPDNAYTIATYVGYDSNEPMVHKWFKAVGGDAIPAWQEIALRIIESQKFAEKLDWEKYASQGNHLIPINYGKSLTQVVLPINSGLSLTAQKPDADIDSTSTDIYANDYSDNGRKTLTVYLEGEASDDIFVPKRKVSFYLPLSPQN